MKTGYIHWQGRFKLKVKARLQRVKSLMNEITVHLSHTAKINVGNFYYVLKDDTRIDGPWRESDLRMVPQLRKIAANPRPWQKCVKTTFESSILDERTIHIIHDEKGDTGKSMFSMYLQQQKLAARIPVLGTFKDSFHIAMAEQKLNPDNKGFIFDIPRAQDLRDSSCNTFAAIEEVKNGYLYDERYNWNRMFIASPIIWLFTNQIPDPSRLTADRWRYYSINENYELVEHERPIKIGKQWILGNVKKIWGDTMFPSSPVPSASSASPASPPAFSPVSSPVSSPDSSTAASQQARYIMCSLRKRVNSTLKRKRKRSSDDPHRKKVKVNSTLKRKRKRSSEDPHRKKVKVSLSVSDSPILENAQCSPPTCTPDVLWHSFSDDSIPDSYETSDTDSVFLICK